jgi:phosphotransferase family enzyme
MRSPEPRVATLVMCTRAGEVLGQLAPFQPPLPWWQDAGGLVEHVRDRHGAEVTILRLLEATLPAPPGGRVTYLAEVAEGQAQQLPLSPWAGVLDSHPLRLPYAEPGGPGRDLAWAASALTRLGLRQTGPAQQVRTWNLSSLWRIPSDQGAAWLKCVPPFFAHEATILTRLQTAAVPQLLASDGCRMLMSEIAGEDQYDAEQPTLRALISILVDLQVQWSGRCEQLLALGLPDWRAEALTQAVDSVVRRTSPDLRDSERRALRRLVDGLPRRFASLAECGIADTLVHGDFAPGNARGADGRLVLLDWGDSGVGHPLLDSSAFLDRIPSGLVPVVRDHWNSLWRRAAPGSDPERAAALLAPVAAARQAVIYRGFLDRIEPSEHPYHRSDPAMWLARAVGLAEAAR